MSSQIQNLKSPTTKKKIKNFAILFFSLFLTWAVFSQVEPKATSDVAFGSGKNLQPSDWLYYKSNNDLSAYLGKKTSSLPTVRYQKNNDYLEFSLNNVSSTTSVSLETKEKDPNNPILFYRNILDGVDANYQITNIPFRVKEEIVLKANSKSQIPNHKQVQNPNDKNSKQKPTTYNLQPTTFLFSAETTGKPVKQKDGSIAFFNNQGEYLFQLDKPFMVDANLNRSEAVTIEIIPNDEVLISNKIPNPNGPTNQNRHPMSVLEQTLDNNNQFLKQLKKFFPVLNLENWNLFRNYNLEIRNLEPHSYQIVLKADAKWLSTATYPVIIDPTVTHNADANFTGQMNRIADSDTTSSTQLESSYPEATKDPYTVLLLHFNEANGATTGITDMASSTRVITANGNASTTSYVKQLGLGNSAAFDGGGDYLTLTSDSDDYTWAGDFSVDIWVRFNDISTYQVLMAHSDDTGANFFRIGWASVASQWSVVLGVTSNQITDSLSTNTWYHIAVVRMGSVVKFFRDGKQVGSDITNSTSVNASTNGIDIGANWNEANTLNGWIDDLRILKGRALTPEEIKAAASRRPYAVYTSPVIDATASVAWNTVNWTEGGVNTGSGEQPYSTNSLVAQWDFNDTSGTTLTASSSGSCTTACNGTLTNFAYTASQDQATTTTGWTANNKKWGAGALMFDGTNDYVEVVDNNNLDITSAITLSAWIKPSGAGDSFRGIIEKGNIASNSLNYELQISNDTTPTLRFQLYDGGFRIADSNTAIQNGVWTYVAITFDGSTVKHYINGNLDKSASFPYTMTANNSNLLIGKRSDGGQFGGIIDSATVYSRALSASEILSNYNAGNVEIQTRTGATSDPNDGSWGAWKPTTGETQLLSMDNDAANWNLWDGSATSTIFNYTGGQQAYTVPAGVTKVTATLYGAGSSGLGGKVVATVGVSPGSTLYVYVGGTSGFNGGGAGGVETNGSAPRGGDASDVRQGGTTLGNRIIVAGGGGGGGGGASSGAGGGGGIVGVDGTAGTHFNGTNGGGGGGGSSVGGAGGSVGGAGASAGGVGDIGVGGAGGDASITYGGGAGGGGGGGYYGGGAGGGARSGAGGGGGGGSSYIISTATATSTSSGVQSGNGQVIISPFATIRGNNETTIKAEGAGSAKLTLGAPQVDGNTVALWHFEETGTTTGTTLYDSTANANNATTTGTTVVGGIFGKARKFNGTGNYVSLNPPVNFPTGASNRTVEAWFNPTTVDSVQRVIVGYGSNVATQEFSVGYNTSGFVILTQSADSGYTTVIPSVGNWYYIVSTYDGTNVKIYVNGQLNSTTASMTINTGIVSGLNIGLRPTNITNGAIGIIDEVKISNRVLSPDEIAETYRMGANHHLTRQVSATDLSGANKLAFNVAGDRPGTYLEAMLGESDYANYELASSTLALSTNTVLYIKGDEIASSTRIKDSSFSGKAITANGDAKISGGGKIGNSVSFDGTGDYLEIADNNDWDFTSSDGSVDFWVYPNSVSSEQLLIGQSNSGSDGNWFIYIRNGGELAVGLGGTNEIASSGYALTTGGWYHIAVVKSGSTTKIYKNGIQIASNTTGVWNNATTFLRIGGGSAAYNNLNGYLDESRILKGIALTPDQVRQAYEYGLRSHQITIDFGATLQPSDLISSATDYNFSITATTSGLSATTSGLYLGDKIIIKENLGGTEYAAQGTVNSINTATGAVTVPSWDTGSTFPAGNGYSPNATVFKWQREYFDITGSLSTHRDAITNLTLRPTNGAEGRTIYLDDFRYNTNYLTASSSSAITSGNNRYLQYRAILTSTDTFVSPFLSAFNTLYTSLANSFPSLIGISGGGFLSF